jgi:hypothetical protein
MPRGSPAAFRATVVFFVGLALVLTGVVVLSSQKGLGLALMGGGLVVVVLSSWVSTLARPDDANDHRARRA